MFGTSGIRGPVGETMTAGVALDVGRALGAHLGARDASRRVVVGRDSRESGTLLLDALAAGLCETGVDVLDTGVAATPTVARAVDPMDAGAGVVITASHNPAPDNGIKLWQPSGQAFDADRRGDIERRITASDWELEAWDGLGSRTAVEATTAHRERLVEATGPVAEQVVVDLGNGAGGVTVDALTDLGCAVETLNAQPDGSFPGRPSEPTAENCESLATLVRQSDATVGIAHDGDADRLRAVAGDGTYLSGDVTLALFAADAATTGDRVAVPVDTSLAVKKYLAERGVGVERTPVGDTYVAAAATAPDVAFGGEPSGAWIWPEKTLCPDGPYAACRLVALANERSLTERASEIPTYPIERGSVAVEAKTAVMERVRERLLADYDESRVSTLDGVRVETTDGWFLLRASGTQPLVRVTAEAHEKQRAAALFAEASEYVETARER
ncbi:phosphoglucosamine mutase [Halosegnis rubeus]|jgi:phosphoglucosamine mutase|uniref:Phosphoglucosamine mutase n=1 Tax=Halosegnis rubeus TaxID=2212850 RepID=A0A5N5U946_9EURY|nr:phosphoglucosamine mutase [Halosegnis rubeus]KAB7515180.1 phosphoglucosamine mutase [Halosegnis rubeus]KAB7516234.1 phosphoglucosamine mutase [Halosegnis rubeus]